MMKCDAWQSFQRQVPSIKEKPSCANFGGTMFKPTGLEELVTFYFCLPVLVYDPLKIAKQVKCLRGLC